MVALGWDVAGEEDAVAPGATRFAVGGAGCADDWCSSLAPCAVVADSVGVMPSLAHDDRGSGPAVVLIHGHPFDRRMWAPQLDALADRLRVVAPDLPGYGESPPGPEPVMTMRALADAVLGLMDDRGIDRATVAGLSMGGLVAMELALAHPDRVAGVVLAATTAAPVDAAEAQAREAQARTLEREGTLPLALEMAGRLFGPAARRDPDLVGGVLTMMLHAQPAGAAAALRGRARRPDYAALLGGLQVPALVIAGDHDGFADETVVDQLVSALPDPTVERLPGVGHLPNLEAPDRFDAALLAFVAAVGGATP